MLLFGCRDEKATIKRAPERELPRTPAPSPVPSGSVVTSLTGRAGDEVTLAGVSDPKAKPHIKWAITGKSPIVVDVTESHHQVVAHVDSPPSCPGEILFTGRVFVAVGLIRQGTTEGEYAEPQLDVAKWRCR
jgi:hypothetical protein